MHLSKHNMLEHMVEWTACDHPTRLASWTPHSQSVHLLLYHTVCFFLKEKGSKFMFFNSVIAINGRLKKRACHHSLHAIKFTFIDCGFHALLTTTLCKKCIIYHGPIYTYFRYIANCITMENRRDLI